MPPSLLKIKRKLISTKLENPEIEGIRMAGMRDKLIHAYFGIDAETIYKAAKTNIPALKQSIQKMLKEQEKK